MPNDHQYSIAYNIEVGKFGKTQLKARGLNGCDQLGFISVIGKFDEGPLSVLPSGTLDNGQPWTDDNWFQVWSMIASQLKESTTLPSWKKEIAAAAFEAVRKVILRH